MLSLATLAGSYFLPFGEEVILAPHPRNTMKTLAWRESSQATRRGCSIFLCVAFCAPRTPAAQGSVHVQSSCFLPWAFAGAGLPHSVFPDFCTCQLSLPHSKVQISSPSPPAPEPAGGVTSPLCTLCFCPPVLPLPTSLHGRVYSPGLCGAAFPTSSCTTDTAGKGCSPG